MSTGEQEVTTPTQETAKAGTPQETVAEEPKTVTYTQEQFSKMQSSFEKKAREAERRSKESETKLNQTLQRFNELEDRLVSAEADRDAKLFAGLDDEPAGQRVKTLYEQIKKAELELKKQQRDFSGVQAEAVQGLKFRDAFKLAKEHEIDVEELMECETYADMVSKAKDVVIERLKSLIPPTAMVETKRAEPVLPKHIDSGVSTSSGGGRVWKASEIQAMSGEDRIKMASEINKATKEGRMRMDQ